MRQMILSYALLLFAVTAFSQTTVTVSSTPPTYKTLNFEFMAGYLNSDVVGVDAREIREGIRNREDNDPDYSGSLSPKSSAYVGILLDYRFHRLVGIGTGLVYSPKGYWQFNKFEDVDARVKNFYTVDYFEFPLFLQFYPHQKVWFRVGPTISFAGITKVRIVTKVGEDKDKEKYRFGENGSLRAKEIVPGLEAALSFGNPSGWHGTFGVQYSGSMYEEIEMRPITLRLGFGYTLSR